MFTAHIAELSSGPVHYQKGGSGPPILHLHPAAGPRLTPVIELLARHHTVFVPAAPGFDGTPKHASVSSMAGLADLMAEFAQRIIGGTCDVVAESFGQRLSAFDLGADGSLSARRDWAPCWSVSRWVPES